LDAMESATQGRVADADAVHDWLRSWGQQAPAVILCDVDLTGEDAARAERLLYCGLMRATVVCDVLAAEGGALTKRLQRAAR